MKYLTFLDYPTLEAAGKSFEVRFKQLEKENEYLKKSLQEVKAKKELEINESTNGIADLAETVKQLQKEIAELKARQKNE